MINVAELPRLVRTGSRETLRRDSSWAVVLFTTRRRRRRNLTRQLRRLDLVQASREPGVRTLPPRRFPVVINDSPRVVWIRHSKGKSISRDAFDRLARRYGRSVRRVAPVYRVPGTKGLGGLVCLLPDVLIVQPASSDAKDLQELDRRLAPLKLEPDLRRNAYLTGFRSYRVVDPRKSSLELAPAARRRAGRLATSVRFERMPLVKPQSLVPNDPFFGDQWGLDRIDAPGAWDLSLGHRSVVAAVIDAGCDLGHQDLDFTDDGIDADDLDGDGSVTLEGNAHGTACAGIIAARTNNDEGVAGIAPRCRLLSVALVEFTDVEVATAIRYAADHGAKVISISLGAYGPDEGLEPVGWDFDVIDPAIDHAFRKSVTICASSGNENNGTFNAYPARHPFVLACGGSSLDDNRKSPRSPDDECWGANFAEGMSVVAPSVQIPTTDIRGADGANRDGGEVKLPCVSYGNSGDEAGDYFLYFNGTSAAAPHVAGVASLIVSTNGYLDARGVRFVIEKTAAKVGSRAYEETADHPVGPWNKRMGYGRLDARAAVDLSASLFIQHMNQLFARG